VELSLKAIFCWCSNGVLEILHSHFSEEAELQDISMDGSVFRAHTCTAVTMNSSAENEVLGRSKVALTVRFMHCTMF